MPIEELNLSGWDFDEVEWRGEVLRADYGAGYGDKVVVGEEGGLHRWRLSAGALTDSAGDNDDIEGVPSFEYCWNFFRRHTTGDNDVFVVEFRSQKYHACFVDPSVTMEVFTATLFGGGVEIRQRRMQGYGYHPDGSLDLTPPTQVTGLEGDGLSESSIRLRWSPATDIEGDIDGGTSLFDDGIDIDDGDSGDV